MGDNRVDLPQRKHTCNYMKIYVEYRGSDSTGPYICPTVLSVFTSPGQRSDFLSSLAFELYKARNYMNYIWVGKVYVFVCIALCSLLL